MAASTRKPTSNNERSSVNSLRRPEEGRSDQPATEREREGASRSLLSHPARTPMPAALRSFPVLRNPATTSPPPELHLSPRPSISGARRVAGGKSAYAKRVEGRGQLVGLVEFLREVRTGVLKGRSLLDGVADGTLWGWRARLALSDVLTQPLADWDNAPGRTQLERLAVVERALAECGVEHRGGWRVSR